MCELIGISSRERLHVNPFLKVFFNHSFHHRHGWGLAIFYGNAVSMEKEPVMANESHYLKTRLQHPIYANNLIGHIRLASIGRMNYENCHPFVKHDERGGVWTLAHNGTIFSPTIQCDEISRSLDDYKSVQEGQTDSERILFFLVDEVNRQQQLLGRAMSDEERFRFIDSRVTQLSVGNKLNLLFWDGENMYVHTNYANSLYLRSEHQTQSTIISTQPLDDSTWMPVPFLQLQVYREGKLIWQGSGQSKEYIDPEKNWEYKNLDFAQL